VDTNREIALQIENDHKGLVAKKGAVKRDNGNPFLVGEKLPIAAKKGFDFGF
jgi:Neuroendocrine protein 7B2 precursor (Secretogranin V)